MFGDISDFGVH